MSHANITADASTMPGRPAAIVTIRCDTVDDDVVIIFRGAGQTNRALAFANDIRGPIVSLKETLLNIEAAALRHGANDGMTFGLATMIASASK